MSILRGYTGFPDHNATLETTTECNLTPWITPFYHLYDPVRPRQA